MILYTFEVVEELHKQSCFQLFSPLTAADTKFICSFWLISLPFQSVCLSSKFSLWKRNKLQKLFGLKTKWNIWLSLDSHFANLLLILPFFRIKMKAAMICLWFNRAPRNSAFPSEASLHRKNRKALQFLFLCFLHPCWDIKQAASF